MSEVITNSKPVLRWVGGKQFLLHRLVAATPILGRRATYFEPFVGAGSLFFALRPRRAVLGDANPHLMDFYQRLRDQANDLIKAFAEITQEDSERHYYDVREIFNAARPSARRAACFLYLNRTCFNGIYRVNQSGAFNVPYGYKACPVFPDRAHLRAASHALANADLCSGSYESTLESARRGDVVYLDPPYPPLNGTSFFTHYTKDRFADLDQERVAAQFSTLVDRGCHVLMTNADTPLIRRLYKGFSLESLSVVRWVTSGNEKHRVRELLISSD